MAIILQLIPPLLSSGRISMLYATPTNFLVNLSNAHATPN
jgi:hypothetical protein